MTRLTGSDSLIAKFLKTTSYLNVIGKAGVVMHA
jgi:hypothetical protein